MKKQKEFEVIFTLDEGYPGYRPHFVDIKDHEIGEDATEADLRKFLEEAVHNHLIDHIFPMVKNSGEFIAWAKKVQEERKEE